MEILISQFKYIKEIDDIIQYINSIYEILLKCQQNMEYENEEKIFTFLLQLDEEIILDKCLLFNFEKYLNGKNKHPLCYKLIKKIPERKRFPLMNEKLKYYEERSVINNVSSLEDNNLKNKLKLLQTITKNELNKIEEHLNDKYFIDKLIRYLKKQSYLFQELNVEEIISHFSISEIDLLKLLIENGNKFNEKALLNLLKGFYVNNKNEIYQTIEILNKIKIKQNIPLVIEKNLNLEEFLYSKEYERIKSFDSKLIQAFDDFSYLKGFSNQHQQFILYLLNINDKIPKDIIFKKLMKFFIEKDYDIGIQIFSKKLDENNLDNFLNYIPDILMKNSFEKIKKLALDKLYNFLKDEHKERILEIIQSFKCFIDNIELPNYFLELLISLIKSEKNTEIVNEFIYFFGIYFWKEKEYLEQDNYLNEVINLVSINEIYQFIKNKVETINKKNEIFYLFACLNHSNFHIDNNIDENNIIKIPTQEITKDIKIFNDKLDDNSLKENIDFFNNYFNFGDFSPERDQILRQLFFNNKKNSINKLKLICY